MANVIEGTCEPRYTVVKEAFEQNFADGDLGASCAVTVEGEVVVDLWGGHRDLARRHRWEHDTIVNMWSTTKMLSALCILMLHDRGRLSIDSPVADYWPEFGQNGKAGVLVRHVMGHTAGLPVFDETVDDLGLFDWDACCARLASQAPRWTPGDGSGYHAETQGWLLGELVRRVEGRTLGSFLKDEVATPLDLDVHIGLPDSEFPRVAEVSTVDATPLVAEDSPFAELARANSRRSAGLVNTTSWRRSELAASNGHGNARAMARAMAPLANAGQVDEVTLLTPATIERSLEVQGDGVDRMLGTPMKFGIGFGLNSDATPLGVNDRTLWWAGWGGSMCVIDLENRLTVSYVMNRMLPPGDLRAARVVFAAHAARQAENSGR